MCVCCVWNEKQHPGQSLGGGGPCTPGCGEKQQGSARLPHLQFSKRVKKVWKPQLFQRELYSEILDTRFTVTVTMRTLDLIDEAYGFDFYILKASISAPGPGSLMRCKRDHVPSWTPRWESITVDVGSTATSFSVLRPSTLPTWVWGLPAAGGEAGGASCWGGRGPARSTWPHAVPPARPRKRTCAPSLGWT